MRIITTVSTIVLASLVASADAVAQLTQADAGRPAKPATTEAPREPSRGPQKPAGTASPIQVDIDGLDDLVPAVALDQDFSIGETSGRRSPQATVSLTRESDEFTAALLKHHTRGTRFREVIISGQTGPAATKLTVKLTDVVIEAVRIRTNVGMAEEVVTLRFAKVWWSNGEGPAFEWNYATMSPR